MITLFTYILSAFSYLIPTCYFLPFKLSLINKITLFIIFFINILMMVCVFGNIGVALLLATSCLYISLIHPNRLLNICMFIATYLFCVIWENFFSLVWYFFGLPISKLRETPAMYILYVILYIMLLNIICPFIAKFTRHFFQKSSTLISKELLKLIIINLLVCVFIFLFNIVIGDYIGYSTKIIVFNFILFGCYFVITTILIVNIIKEHLEKINMEVRQDSYEQLQTYTNQIETMYSSLRAFKHDYSNIMLSLSGYIDSGDIEGLKHYFYNEIIPINERLSSSTTRMYQLMNIKVIELKSIISAKLLYANTIGIDINIEIEDVVDDIPIDTIDMARILGVFLDNAIEAAVETPAPLIQFAVIKEKNELVFIISNSFTDNHIPCAMLQESGVSTKGSNRGFGLHNTRSIISQYNDMFLDTEILDDMFIQRLKITTTSI